MAEMPVSRRDHERSCEGCGATDEHTVEECVARIHALADQVTEEQMDEWEAEHYA